MLAVPLHGDDVAPRFCSADRFLIAEVDGNQAHRIRRLTLSDVTWSQCLERLSAAGVRVLLCGGFNRSFLPLAESLGIRVISGLAGEAEQLIDAFLRDEIEQYRFLPRRGKRRGRPGGGGRAGATSESFEEGREWIDAGIRQDRSGGSRTAHGTRRGPLPPSVRKNEIGRRPRSRRRRGAGRPTRGRRPWPRVR